MAFPNDQYFELVDRIPGGDEGTPLSAASGDRRYKQEWLVITKDRHIGAVAVCFAPGLPIAYSPYYTESPDGVFDSDLLALLVNKSAKRDKDDAFRWIVTCEYSNQMPNTGPQNGLNGNPFYGNPGGGGNGGPGGGTGPNAPDSSNDPEMERPEVSWDFEVTQRALYMDNNGNAFCNSAGEPYLPQPTFEFAYPVLSLSRNEYGFNVSRATDYAFAVNKEKFLGWPPGSVQCLPPKAVQKYTGSKVYWRVSYKLRFGTLVPDKFPSAIEAQDPVTGAFTWKTGPKRYHHWQPEFIDQGLNKYVFNPDYAIGNGKPREILVPITRGSVPVTQPYLLDGAGHEPKSAVLLPPNTTIEEFELDPTKGFRAMRPYTRIQPVYNVLSFKSLLTRGLS